jgi:hypothetical protein
MARTAKITNANVAPRKNAAGLVGNTPVRAQDFNDLAGDYVSLSDANAQSIASAVTVSGATALSSTLAVTGDSTLTGAVTATAGVQSAAVAIVATADGTGTGTIPAGTSVASIVCGAAARIVILPAPVIGNIIHLIETATTGYELRTSAPASIGINGGTASNGESAVPGATTYTRCVCVSATNWICNTFDADGDEAKLEQAAA